MFRVQVSRNPVQYNIGYTTLMLGCFSTLLPCPQPLMSSNTTGALYHWKSLNQRDKGERFDRTDFTRVFFKEFGRTLPVAPFPKGA